MHSGYPSINHRLTEPTWQGPDEEAAERRVVCVVLNIGEERAIVGVRYGDGDRPVTKRDLRKTYTRGVGSCLWAPEQGCCMIWV